ncbi:substrate-binding domain-containing protein [Microbacterium sp.]|uniref:substrate-binding domain-containing protein n=1 Tax=Microbacterium sp. TaxID=51671 RepID=UPI0037C6A2B5
MATYQVCDWKTPLAADVLLSRHYPGDGVIDFASLTRAVEATGYDRDIEVEIFNEEIWATEPLEAVRRTAAGFAAAVSPQPPRIAIVSDTSEPVRPDAVRAGAVTLHDVAREAGVSLATASRALNGSARKVADSYRERVQAAAARLGYTANLSAQATARGTSAIIALLVADIADPYFGEIASGVARGADEEGLVVTVAITERDPAREVRLVRALRGQRPRGLILAASRASKDIAPDLSAELDQFAAAGGRVVALGTGSEVVRGVAIDNRGGAAELGAALAARGYRTAVVLAAAEGVVTSDDRVAGFADGFGAGGGEIGAVLRGGFTRESGHDLMAQALAAGVAPGTVVFGISDVVAIGALSALREAGRSVGDDVALAGFDDIPTGRDVTPALTTVRIPLEEVGYQALHAATDADWEPAALRLEVLLRDSTPPRDAGA